MKSRILVTTAGGTLAPLNIRLMKASRYAGVWILGVDSREDATGRHFADAFALVPDGSAPGYVDTIVELITKYGINIVLPWSDEEALALASQRARVEAVGAILACAPFATLQIMSDKFATYELMAKVGIEMPAYVKTQTPQALVETVDYFAREFGEFAVKPVTARGNRGTVVVRKDISGARPYMGSRELHMDIETFRRHHLGNMPASVIVMERLLAPAYDIDVLARAGKVLRAMPRRRLNPAGIPFTGSVLMPHAPLLDLADQVTSALDLSWLYDYDIMTNVRGGLVPIEINPRPSGSIAASILAGEPFYDDLFALVHDEPLSCKRVTKETMVLPFTDCIVLPETNAH